MINILYDKDLGLKFSDGELLNQVNLIIDNYNNGIYFKDYCICVSNELFILAFRMAIKNKAISNSEVKLIFDNQSYDFDSDGRIISSTPINFGNLLDTLLAGLL